MCFLISLVSSQPSYLGIIQAEYRADSAEAEVNRRTMDIKKAKERIITERAMYETLRKEMDTMINEFHSI
uniref:SJCHGC02065 protein n=1 Tax=Schistosoma japonicum TaxID=6182 RepID=Q3KTL0_SCHJA|nr:SJCHGC02065 protein [Schistosoma japonicum]